MTFDPITRITPIHTEKGRIICIICLPLIQEDCALFCKQIERTDCIKLNYVASVVYHTQRIKSHSVAASTKGINMIAA